MLESRQGNFSYWMSTLKGQKVWLFDLLMQSSLSGICFDGLTLLEYASLKKHHEFMEIQELKLSYIIDR